MKISIKVIAFILTVLCVGISPIKCVNLSGHSVEGSIIYPPNFPASISSESCLIIKLEDVSMADAPSVQLSKQVIMAPSKEKHTMYSLKLSSLEIDGRGDIAVSATLNVDWCSETNNNGEWFRPKDYLTDTRFTVDLLKEATNKKKIIKGPAIKLVSS